MCHCDVCVLCVCTCCVQVPVEAGGQKLRFPGVGLTRFSDLLSSTSRVVPSCFHLASVEIASTFYRI